MRKFLFAATLLGAFLLWAEDSQYAVTVGTNSMVIAAPAYQPADYAPWTASTAVTNGMVLRETSTKNYYMVLTAGTTGTNAPTTKARGKITDGTAELLYINRRGRKKVFVTQESDASVWYHTGKIATTNGGEYAFSRGQQFSTDSSDFISAIADGDVKLNIRDD